MVRVECFELECGGAPGGEVFFGPAESIAKVPGLSHAPARSSAARPVSAVLDIIGDIIDWDH
jgi:hypothetical protein